MHPCYTIRSIVCVKLLEPIELPWKTWCSNDGLRQSDGPRLDKFVVECKGKELLTFKTRDQSNVVFTTLKLWLRFGNKGRQKGTNDNTLFCGKKAWSW